MSPAFKNADANAGRQSFISNFTMQSSNILSLPYEICLLIYEYILLEAGCTNIWIPLLRVCHQIHDEVTEVLQHNGVVHMRLSHLTQRKAIQAASRQSGSDGMSFPQPNMPSTTTTDARRIFWSRASRFAKVILHVAVKDIVKAGSQQHLAASIRQRRLRLHANIPRIVVRFAFDVGLESDELKELRGPRGLEDYACDPWDFPADSYEVLFLNVLRFEYEQETPQPLDHKEKGQDGSAAAGESEKVSGRDVERMQESEESVDYLRLLLFAVAFLCSMSTLMLFLL